MKNRKHLHGEICFYFAGNIYIPLGTHGHERTIHMPPRNGAYRTINGWAEKKAPYEYGVPRTKQECTAMARDLGKHAVFIVEQGTEEYPRVPRRPVRPKTPLELADETMSEEQRVAIREIWAKIDEQQGPLRGIAYLDAEKVLGEECVAACRGVYLAGTRPIAEVGVDVVAKAKRRCKALGAALEWLRLKAGGES